MKESETSTIEKCFVVFWVIIGIIGILHGSAELLKGLELIESHSVEALPKNWPDSEFYTLMNGAPVFSLLSGIPYYVLGLLAISISVALIVFSAKFFRLDFKGVLLFALLSLGIYLFGAGEGTPIGVSLPLVIFGTILIFYPKKRERSTSSKRILLYGINVFYGLKIFSWILFFPGLFILSFYQ